jgi:hypothetical protein
MPAARANLTIPVVRGAETPQERDAAVSTQSDHLRVAQLTGGPVTALRIFDVIAWMEGKEQGL